MVAIKGVMIECLDDGPTLEKGGYIFYSGFKYGSSKTSNVTKRIKVNQFFFVRISRHDDPCIGELVSIWKDKYRDTMLASVRLYFLPEQTPDGRQSNHGQHEVLAASEPVILRLNDLVSWITEEVDWVIGLEVPFHATHIDPPPLTLPFLNLINDANKQIPLRHDNSNPQQQHPIHHQQSNEKSNQHEAETKNMDTINVQDNKQLTGDQQQSTSSSSSPTLTSSSSSSSSSSQINKNSLIGVIDSQIGNQSVIVVLSYPAYCRYRALLKKMEENMKEKENISVNCQSNLHLNSSNSNDTECNNDTKAPSSLTNNNDESINTTSTTSTTVVDGGETKSEIKSVPLPSPPPPTSCMRILFCRETFEHEGLLHHDLNCEHLAPKLKGRPRKRGANHNHHHNNNNHTNASSAANNKTTTNATATTSSHSSSSAQDSDTSEENSKQDSSRVRLPRKSSANTKVKSSSSIEVDCAFQGNTNATTKHKSKPPAMSLKLAEKCLKNESEFMKQLNKFMKERNTPITRIPHLGFKKIDLFYLFTFTQKLGGYEKITQNKEWKKVYDELGGDPRSTSAATCTRRHFERLLLPFENHLAEARGIVVTRRSTRGRSISPMLPAGSPATTKGGADDDYQSVGSVNSTERRSHRRSHRRQGVRQSKRLKGVASSSSTGVGTSNGGQSSSGAAVAGSAHGSNASTTATDDDECYSPMSNEDEAIKEEIRNWNGDNSSKNNEVVKGRASRSSAKERGSTKLSGVEEETHSMSSSSSKSVHDDDNGAKNYTNKENANDSMTEEEEEDDNIEDEEEEGEEEEGEDGEGGGRRKRKRRKGKSLKVKCKSRSPSVENNLNSSNVKRPQSERKFVVKIDGLSTGDPKVRNEDEIMSEGGVTIKDSSPPSSMLTTSKNESMETEDENVKCDSLTKEETDPKKLVKESGPLINVEGDKLIKSEVKPFDPTESVEVNNKTADGKLLKLCNNLPATGTNDCDTVNSTLSKSDRIATINANQTSDNQGNIVASPLSSISTLISAMDVAKQQQQVHLTREMKLDPSVATINTDHQSTVNMVGQTNVNIVQANVNSGGVGSGGGNNNGGVKKSLHQSSVKNNATVFQNINSSRSSSSSSSTSSPALPSSGRPSVIQKTPLKPCVKVVPTYKDNPIDGLLKDNSLLKKITLPPIAHAASFLSSSPTWFSQPFTTESSTSQSTTGSPLVNKSKTNLSSLKRKLVPSSIEESPDLIPLDLTNKKRLLEMDSDATKGVPIKGKVPALVKTIDGDICPPPTILDLSSKVRVKENSSKNHSPPGNNIPQLTNNVKNDTNNNNHRPSSHQQHHQPNHNPNANVDGNLIPVPKVPKSNANINERVKSNSSKSGAHYQQPPPSVRHHVNQSPLPVSSPVPVSGIIPPSSTPLTIPTMAANAPISSKPHHHSSSSTSSTSTHKHHNSSSNRSQMVKPSPSPTNALKAKESKSNHLLSVNHHGFGLKDLNQQQFIQTHPNEGISNQQQSQPQQQHHSHHQRRQQQQQQQPPSSHHQPQHHQQQLPLQLPAIPFPSDNRDIQSKLQSANTLNQLRAMVTPENFALAQQTIAQEIALREMERLHPNLAKQMSQMSSAAAAAAVLGYPAGFHPMLNMPTHRSTVPSSSPSISEYNPTLPSFLPFLNSFVPHSATTGTPGGNGAPGLPHPSGISNPNAAAAAAAAAANNVNSAVAAAAAALASGHLFNPAALAAASQGAGFSPLELFGGDERFSAAAAAAAAAAAENDARWRGGW